VTPVPPTDRVADDIWRAATPQVVAALVRRYGDFDRAEEATQEALLAASVQWPRDGLPDDPKAWLVRVASRRLVDAWRSDTARERREADDAARLPADAHVAAPADASVDDTLTLLLLCCHPALTPPAQIALTLRAVGGLTTAEIARAFLVPEATMAQRISRAKARIRDTGARFEAPSAAELPERMSAVLHVLYLVFTEGHTATSGEQLHRVDLTAEAIRLARVARRLRPDDGEVAGLLALMLLTEARRPARLDAEGGLVLLADQDRTRWDHDAISEGVALVEDALTHTALGPYQVQAAIAAVHDEAATSADTDWPQVLALYDVLERLTPGPVVALNRAVALAMVEGPAAGLRVVDALATDRRLARHHRLHAVRAHLLETAGDTDAAREEYVLASRLATSIPEQDHLRRKAESL
jgi:RNA polymerase sigma factor (sigma-70 family)